MFVAYFGFNSDGDFYFKDYKNLNMKTVTFSKVEDALEVMRLHFQTAIDTMSCEDCKINKSLFNEIKETGRELLATEWKAINSKETHIEDAGRMVWNSPYVFAFNCDFGNYDFDYYIVDTDLYKNGDRLLDDM